MGARLGPLTERFCPEKGNGWPAIPLLPLLRIHGIQHWFGEADPAMQEALHDIPYVCRLAGLDAFDDVMLDECAILRFSHLPEQHQLGKTIVADVAGELSGKGLSTMRGTVVDAVLITAPSSTRSDDNHVANKRSPSASGTIGRRTGPSQ